MNTSIKTIITILVLVVTFQSCDQIQTLQTYYVDKELDPGFMAWDVPPTIINIEDLQLTEAQEEAYKSIEKLSLLTFLKEESNQEAYDLEIAKVKAILDDSKYEELMRGGNSTDGKFVIKCLASEGEDVDEFILFGNSNETGFAVVRIIGDDMNFSKIMELASVLQDSNFNENQLNEVTKFFK